MYSLPVALQIGFAGARNIFPSGSTEHDINRYEQEVIGQLVNILDTLRRQAQADGPCFLVGVSQVARGADSLFARACAKLEIPHRILLPQPFNEYVVAHGVKGPDFMVGTTLDATGKPLRNEPAQALVDISSPNVIEVQCVSKSNDRHERFTEANLAILNESDLIIGLRPINIPGSPGKGGTIDLIVKARQQAKPVVELTVDTGTGQAVVRGAAVIAQLRGIKLPSICSPYNRVPDVLSYTSTASEYASAVKAIASHLAKSTRLYFHSSIRVILLTHVFATFLAAFGLAFKDDNAIILIMAVFAEFAALLYGLYTHVTLSGSAKEKQWAQARLMAELMRSVIDGTHRMKMSLRYLLAQPVPEEFKPLLRTLNILQLRDSRGILATGLQSRSQGYVSSRINHQIDKFLKPKAKQHHYAHLIAEWVFYGFTGTTLLVILLKCLWALEVDVLHALHKYHVQLAILAVVGPVLAVAALSWSHAVDNEALEHTYDTNVSFLEANKAHVELVDSDTELVRLVVGVESRLLAEITSWYARRSYKGIS